MTSIIDRRYGWRPDKPDIRDFRLSVPVPVNVFTNVAVSLPSAVDLRPGMPPVYEQGQLGSCTSNAIAAAIEYDRKKQGLPDFVPSRLFIYYNERVIEGTISEDAGAELRDGIKSVVAQGVCAESDWPYDTSRFNVAPPQQCYNDAHKDVVVKYQRLYQNLGDMRACLANGFPFVVGFSVYESFENEQVAQTGIVPIPSGNEQLLGGHAVLVAGYDNDRQSFLVRNSWGPGWGEGGHCWMPFTYLTSPTLAGDLWQINFVGDT
jgi:C1A family cysteine protease